MADRKYDRYFLSDGRTEPKANDYTSLNSLPPFPEIAGPQTYFRGAAALPGAGISIGWQVFTKPVSWETPHVHQHDEYLMFLGSQLPDLCKSFDAEIDLWMGKEMEKHTITSTTVVYIPKGVWHYCPLNFRVINRPVLFHALYLGPVLDARRAESFDETNFDWEGPVNFLTFGPTEK